MRSTIAAFLLISAVASNACAQSQAITGTVTDALGLSDSFSVTVMQGITSILPSVRLYDWKPGMTYNGGIPARTTICATLSPLASQDNAPQIQTAINNCPPGQVVFLNAGTYQLSGKQNSPVINKAITLRGAGVGTTILIKTNGAEPRTTTLAAGTTNTVSYTHLDVYKRQSSGTPAVTASAPLAITTATGNIALTGQVPLACLLYTSRCV